VLGPRHADAGCPAIQLDDQIGRQAHGNIFGHGAPQCVMSRAPQIQRAADVRKRSACAGEGAVASIARKRFKFDLSRPRQAEALPSASSISASEAFSASLTVTPPSPKKPPSDEASATVSPMSRSHNLTAAPSSGALLSR
jgi:hypothetical protein